MVFWIATLLILTFFGLPEAGNAQYSCYTCVGGPESQCANVTAIGVTEPCTGSYCYEAYILYQGGAMPIVQRRCWMPPNNTRETNYCKWAKTSSSIINSHATIVDCSICSSELCNTNLRFWDKRN